MKEEATSDIPELERMVWRSICRVFWMVSRLVTDGIAFTAFAIALATGFDPWAAIGLPVLFVSYRLSGRLLGYIVAGETQPKWEKWTLNVIDGLCFALLVHTVVILLRTT